jgi:hypothetical protein
MDRDQERIDQLSRIFAAGSSRRGILRALGVVGASGLLAVAGHEAIAGERPHQRLQGRTPKRNRKQRNNKNQNNNNDNNGGSQLGSGQDGPTGLDPTCESGCQEQYEGCMEPCAGHGGSLEYCEERCDQQQSECEARCFVE